MIERDQTVQRFPLGGWQRSRSRPRRAADDRPLGTHPRPVADAASACPCQRPPGRSQRPAGACAWSTHAPPAAGTSQTPGDDSGRPKHTRTGLAMADNGKSLRWLEFSRNLDPYAPHSRRFDHPSKPRARRLVRGRPSTPRLTLVQEARSERPAVVVRFLNAAASVNVDGVPPPPAVNSAGLRLRVRNLVAWREAARLRLIPSPRDASIRPVC